MRYEEVDINLIKENDYNPNTMTESVYEHLKQEIKRVGFLIPVIIRPDGTNFIIVDGEHRYRVAKTLKMKKIPCIIVETTEEEAKIQTININRIRGEFNPIKFAKLLTDLELKIKKEDLQSYIRMNEEELTSYKLLLKMPEDWSTKPKVEPEQDMPFLFHVPKTEQEMVEKALVRSEGDTNDIKFLNLCRKSLKEDKVE